MANYTEEDVGRLTMIITNILESSKLQEELARNVALKFGAMLEPMIKAEVRNVLAKAEVRFK